MKDLQIITDKINAFKEQQFQPFHHDLTRTFKNTVAAMLWDLAKTDDSLWRFKLHGRSWHYFKNDVELEPIHSVIADQDWTYGDWDNTKFIEAPWNKTLTEIDKTLFILINEHMEMVSIDFMVTHSGGPFPKGVEYPITITKTITEIPVIPVQE